MQESIINIVNTLPQHPGVYQFFDKQGQIIYIGKAKNLKKRVQSYFSKRYESYKLKVLTNQIFDIKHIIVESESDALLLENNLIKKWQPKYNVLLKDDKTFPWICIKNEPFPRVFLTRTIYKDGSEYFGPYTSAFMARTLLLMIRELYPLRTCSHNLNKENILKAKFRRCLEYHLDNCKAPCENLQTDNDYLVSIDQIRKILKGNIQEVILHLETMMFDFSENYKFENANIIKQKILLLEKYKSKSTIVNPKIHNVDVFSFIDKNNISVVNFLKIINGAIVQSHTVEIINKLINTKEELLSYAIMDIRKKTNSRSKEMIVPFYPDGIPQDIRYVIPKTGDKKKLLELSEKNAYQYIMQKEKLDEKTPATRQAELLRQVKNDLQLKEIPERIECFDNSNIQGQIPVASCVVFINGKPSKKDYRHFNIKTVQGANDFASMEEVVFRRYRRQLDECALLPQLIIIDGGKGQLNAAVKSLKILNLCGNIAIIGIAKRLEEIYFPHDQVPLYIDKSSPTLKLIQNLRNEAHRYGISFHRNKRSGNLLQNQLEQIKGIGRKTAEKLLIHFGSVETLLAAPNQEIEKIIGKKLTFKLLSEIRKTDN